MILRALVEEIVPTGMYVEHSNELRGSDRKISPRKGAHVSRSGISINQPLQSSKSPSRREYIDITAPANNNGVTD